MRWALIHDLNKGLHDVSRDPETHPFSNSSMIHLTNDPAPRRVQGGTQTLSKEGLSRCASHIFPVACDMLVCQWGSVVYEHTRPSGVSQASA